MALKTWDEIGNLGLTAGQKNIAAAFEAIGTTPREETPDISGVTPQQAKAVLNWYRDLYRIQAAMLGAKYVLNKLRDDTGKAAVDAVPDGNL